MMKKITIFFKKKRIFPQNVPLDTKNAVLTTRQKLFWFLFEKLGFCFEKKPDFLRNHLRWQICCRMRIK